MTENFFILLIDLRKFIDIYRKDVFWDNIKSYKKPGFTLFLEDTFFKKPQGGGSIWPPLPQADKGFFFLVLAQRPPQQRKKIQFLKIQFSLFSSFLGVKLMIYLDDLDLQHLQTTEKVIFDCISSIFKIFHTILFLESYIVFSILKTIWKQYRKQYHWLFFPPSCIT